MSSLPRRPIRSTKLGRGSWNNFLILKAVIVLCRWWSCKKIVQIFKNPQNFKIFEKLKLYVGLLQILDICLSSKHQSVHIGGSLRDATKYQCFAIHGEHDCRARNSRHVSNSTSWTGCVRQGWSVVGRSVSEN